MCDKGRIRHEMQLHSTARNLPHHVLADVDWKRQQAKNRAQRYMVTDGDHRQAVDASRRCLSHRRENDSWHRLLQE